VQAVEIVLRAGAKCRRSQNNGRKLAGQMMIRKATIQQKLQQRL
jgi:hypothetical protein